MVTEYFAGKASIEIAGSHRAEKTFYFRYSTQETGKKVLKK